MKYYFQKGLLIFLVVTSVMQGQIEPGARQIAMANSTVALANDVFAIFQNPAGLAGIRFRELGLFYSPDPFGLKQLANKNAAYSEPFDFATIAFGIKHYGFKLYTESEINFAIARKLFRHYLFGFSIALSRVDIDKYGTATRLFCKFGFLYHFTHSFSFGFSAENLRGASYSENYRSIPTILRTGISYKPIKNASLNFEIYKDLDRELSLRGGIEYAFLNHFFLRFGVRNKPDTYTAGIGIKYSFLQLDYAVFTHPYLGLTHQAGIVIRIKKFLDEKNE